MTLPDRSRQAARRPMDRAGGWGLLSLRGRWVFWLLPLALLVAGCAGYKLGPTNGLRSGERSIQVNPFANKVLEGIRLGEPVTIALRRQLQQDDTYRLDTHDDGDIVVSGVIVGYDRANVSYQPQDTLTPRDYRLTMIALVNARERTSGKVILNRRVSGHTMVRITADITSAERQAIPLAAEDLARNITSLLVDGEW